MSVVFYPKPGHFVAAYQCCYRAHAVVDGRWKVSAVGCYHPADIPYSERCEDNRETLAADKGSFFEVAVFDMHDDRTISMKHFTCEADATAAFNKAITNLDNVGRVTGLLLVEEVL